MDIYNQFKISLRKHHFQIIGNLLFYSFISCYPYEKEQDLYSGTYELKTEALDATWKQIHRHLRGEEKLPIIGDIGDFNNDCSNKLVINEFMAHNETTSADQDDEYDPWIELYNNSPEEIPLNGKSVNELTNSTTESWGYFLSDNDSIWAFPDDAKIPGNDFLVVWADNETDQKGLHTNFKLPALGGTLFLLYLVTTITNTETTTDTTIVNQINYFEQVPDLSLGRYPNGVGLFYTMFPTDTSVNKLSFSGVEFFTNLNKTVYRTVSDTGYIDWSTKENCSDPVQIGVRASYFKCYYKKEYDWDKGQKEGEFLVDAMSRHLLPSNLDRLKIELSFPVLGMNYNNKNIYSNDLIMTYNFNEVIGTYFKKISDEVNSYPECTSF